MPLRFAGPSSAPALQVARSDQAVVPTNEAIATATVQITPWSNWFGRLTVLRFLTPGIQKPWNPDFTYVVGYDDWRPDTTSLTYEHYGGNRFLGGGATFTQGSLVLGRKLPAAAFWPAWLGMPSASFSFALTPVWQDATGATRYFKQGLRARVNYRLPFGLTAWMAPGIYVLDAQQPWDPDYTFGLAMDEGGPGGLTAQYANYAGTRFPWRNQAGAAGFFDGSLTIGYGGSF